MAASTPTSEYKATSPPLPPSAAVVSVSNLDHSKTRDFPTPAAKRARISPQAPGSQSQHVSPYTSPLPAQSASATSSLHNGTVASPIYNHTPSPHFPAVPYTTPYSNGSTPAPTSIMNPKSQSSQSTSRASFASNLGSSHVQAHQTHNQFAPHHTSFTSIPRNSASSAAGNMGPPMKPSNENDPNHTDILTGTGIDLREEEAYSQSQFAFAQTTAGSHITAHSAKVYPPNVAGPAEAFYGSGRASQPAEHPGDFSQEEWENKVAKEEWHAAAERLALSREAEMKDPFCAPKIVQEMMKPIVQTYGLRMNTVSEGHMGTARIYSYEELPVRTTTKVSNGQATILTNGRAIPTNVLLVDQLILCSLAARHRILQLLEDVVKLARGRQTGSSGFAPSEWADVAVPIGVADGTRVSLNPQTARTGWDSAVSPRTNPLKRNQSQASLPDGNNTSVAFTANFPNEYAKSLRETARVERDMEEERLRKRAARKNSAVRSASVAHGGPGSVSSTGSFKAPTRKELDKKNKKKKEEDAASNTSANATSNMFLGSLGKKKKYDWMSAASTSTAAQYSIRGSGGGGGGGVRAGAGTPAAPDAPVELTQRGQTTMGNWREDKSSGAKIQMRDWVTALQRDDRCSQELQRALTWLDGNTKPRALDG